MEVPNLPAEKVRRRVAIAAASPFDEVLSELSRSSAAQVSQAEQLVARAAVDFDAFYQARQAAEGRPVADDRSSC